MGYSIAWIAFKNMNHQDVIEHLGLRSTGQKASCGEAAFTGCELSKDWFLVVANDCDSPLVSQESLAGLSIHCEALACSVEEHVMYASAELWKEGRRIWRIAHDAQQSVRHIEADGDLPSGYTEALRAAAKEQDEEDVGSPTEVDFYFEVPLDLAKGLVGFKHDEESAGVDHDAFTVYESVKSPDARRWWQIWR